MGTFHNALHLPTNLGHALVGIGNQFRNGVRFFHQGPQGCLSSCTALTLLTGHVGNFARQVVEVFHHGVDLLGPRGDVVGGAGNFLMACMLVPPPLAIFSSARRERSESWAPSDTRAVESLMSWVISLAASDDRWASLPTSSATTANPLPCAPARAASMAAFRDSRLVCSAISVITVMISEICSEDSQWLSYLPPWLRPSRCLPQLPGGRCWQIHGVGGGAGQFLHRRFHAR
jgi:hypothetical protein